MLGMRRLTGRVSVLQNALGSASENSGVQDSKYPELRDIVAFRIGILPPLRCLGFIQAGNNLPMHAWMEQLSPRGQRGPGDSLGPGSPYTLRVPAAPPYVAPRAVWRCARGRIHSAQPLQPWGTSVTVVVPPFVTAIRCGTQQGQLAGAARHSRGHVKHAVEMAA